MDVNLINPFIEATLHVLSSMAFTEATAGKPFLKNDNIASGDVTGVVGLIGEARGTISVSFTEECILSIVGNMFGEDITHINDEVKDAVGEILNIVSGQARQKLEMQGRILKAPFYVITARTILLGHIPSNPTPPPLETATTHCSVWTASSLYPVFPVPIVPGHVPVVP